MVERTRMPPPPQVPWKKVYSLKRREGLGLKKLKPFKRALISKVGWQLVENVKDKAKIFKAKYLNNASNGIILLDNKLPSSSSILNNLSIIRIFLWEGEKINGNERCTRFWEDMWLKDKALANLNQFNLVKNALIECSGTLVQGYLSWQGDEVKWKTFLDHVKNSKSIPDVNKSQMMEEAQHLSLTLGNYSFLSPHREDD